MPPELTADECEVLQAIRVLTEHGDMLYHLATRGLVQFTDVPRDLYLTREGAKALRAAQPEEAAPQ